MLINVLLYTFGYFKYNQKGIRITQNEKNNNQNGNKKFVVFKIYDFCVNLMFSVDN